MIVPEAARPEFEDEALGPASVLLVSHKGGRGHHKGEKEAGQGGSRERGGPRGEGGGAGKMKLTFRNSPQATKGGGRQGRRRNRGRARGRVRREEVRATIVASQMAERASLGVGGRRDDEITELRSRGRML